MPVDKNGNRADVIIYGGSTIKRTNFGRMYEHFINAASRDLLHRLRKAWGIDPHMVPTRHQLNSVQDSDNFALVEWSWALLMGYYAIVAPLQYDMMETHPDTRQHIKSVLADGIYLYVPPNNPVDNLAMANALKNSEYCPDLGPVTYIDNAGREVTTEENVLIGGLYMILLEKTGEDWSGVASVKTQHFGVPAKLNNHDKQTTPGREAPVRGLGESETRSFVTVVGPKPTMELLDQSNNPESHREAVRTLLNARTPSAIEQIVNREKVPLGGSRPVGFVHHLLNCRGLKFTYRPDIGEEV